MCIFCKLCFPATKSLYFPPREIKTPNICLYSYVTTALGFIELENTKSDGHVVWNHRCGNIGLLFFF